MAVNFDPLVADDLDPSGSNAAAFAAVLQDAAGRSDAIPFLLFPVKIETRFVKSQRKIAEPASLDLLKGHITAADAALRDLAALDFATTTEAPGMPGRTAQREQRKEQENRTFATGMALIGSAATAIAVADRLARAAMPGTEAKISELALASAALTARLGDARRALGTMRSVFQRSALEQKLDHLNKDVARLQELITRQTIPMAIRSGDTGQTAQTTLFDELWVRIYPDDIAVDTHEDELTGSEAESGERFWGDTLASGNDTVLLLAAWRSLCLRHGPRRAAWIARQTEPAGGYSVADAPLLRSLTALERRIDEVSAGSDPNRNRALERAVTDLEAALAKVQDADPGALTPDDVAIADLRRMLVAIGKDTNRSFQPDELRKVRRRAVLALRKVRVLSIPASATEAGNGRPEATETRGSKALWRALNTFTTRLGEVADWDERRSKRWTQALERALDEVRAELDRKPSVSSRVAERATSLMALIEVKLAGLAIATDRKIVRDTLRRRVTVKSERMRKAWRVWHGSDASIRPDTIPAFRQAARKVAAWSRAASSPILPDRFVVVTVSGGKVSHLVVGNPVPSDLRLGLDPAPGSSELFSLDSNGDLSVGASIRWMVDYDAALAKGMAITVPISPGEALAGFDQVYVLGLCSGDAADGKDRLTALLDNHHYGQTGLGLLPVGTPTNNSNRDASGFRSDESADSAYTIERGPSLVAQGPDADGARLARALGIEPEAFAHVQHADGRDISDALIVNAALWPATMGHYLEEFFGALLPVTVLDRIKAHALSHVAGRGLLSGLRIGTQPYGVLPTAAFSRFAPRDSQDRFGRVLGSVLATMNDDWTRIRGKHIYTMSDPRITEPQAQFLKVLGLEAVSVAADYRFALNCARQQPATSGAAGFLDFGIPGTEAGPSSFGPAALIERFAGAFRDGLQLPPGPVLTQGQISPAFDKAYKRLRKARAYEVRYLSGAKPLFGTLLGNHFTEIPFLLSQTAAALARQTIEDGTEPKALLYLLIRHALLLETREAALRILADAGMLTSEARRRSGESDVFQVQTLSADWSVTRWSYLFAPLGQLDGRFGIDFPNQPGTLYAYLDSVTGRAMDAYVSPRRNNPVFEGFAGRAAHQSHIDGMSAHAAKVQALAALPGAKLETMMLEHLDTCSHRLDAWITSLAHRRLQEMRTAQPEGINIGAFGWVEDLRPDALQTVKTDVLEAFGDPATQAPVHIDPDNAGFIHAPSLSHAATAAILRSGYLSEATDLDLDNRMAVNLSSRRVRIASGIISDIQVGNDLGSVLGYHFERALHDSFATSKITLDDLIGPLRRAYPSAIAVDPALAADASDARRVIDGLSLLQTVLEWVRADTRAQDRGATLFDILRDSGRYTGHPFGIVGESGTAILPSPDDAEGQLRLDGVLRALDQIADALDSLGDLVISESVYQIVQGNHSRAAAVIAALAQGKTIPDPEIVRTPRSGLAVSHRLVAAMVPADARTFSPELVAEADLDKARRENLPSAWSDLPMTPRAAAEASLNRWLGDRLGSPERIVARITDEATGQDTPVSVADLGLQPIDLLMILGPGFETGLTELDARILEAGRPADIDEAALPAGRMTVRHDRARDWTRDTLSFPEVSALLEAAHECIAHAQPASRQDFVLSESLATPAATDLAELDRRVEDTLAALRSAAGLCLSLLSDGAIDKVDKLEAADIAACVAASEARLLTAPEAEGRRLFNDIASFWSQRERISEALFAASAFGIPRMMQAFVGAGRPRETAARDWLDALQSACTGLAERWRAAAAANSARTGASDPVKAAVGVLKAVFGEAFPVLPLFTLDPASDAVSAMKAGTTLPDDPSLSGWLHGIAAVRDNASALSQMMLLGAAFGGSAAQGLPIQLPFVAGEPWLGAALPSGFVSTGGRLCLAIYGAEALARDGGHSCGLVIDHWDEVIPSAEETTGVAFNYDQPDAMPPQCLLLVVPPVVRGTWRWSDLLQTLHDTLELAKNRSVELEHLQDDLYGQILPALVGEIVPEAVVSGGAGIAGSRVVLDFGKNNPPQPNGVPSP